MIRKYILRKDTTKCKSNHSPLESAQISLFLEGSQITPGSHIWNSTDLCFPGSSVVKTLPASAEDAGSNPGSGRSSREGNGNPLQYSCPGNSMDRGAWQSQT